MVSYNRVIRTFKRLNYSYHWLHVVGGRSEGRGRSVLVLVGKSGYCWCICYRQRNLRSQAELN